MDWEEESYLQGCAYARELAEHRLSALDYGLMRRIYRQRSRASDWADASVPVLNGLHNSRPWEDRVATPSS